MDDVKGYLVAGVQAILFCIAQSGFRTNKNLSQVLLIYGEGDTVCSGAVLEKLLVELANLLGRNEIHREFFGGRIEIAKDGSDERSDPSFGDFKRGLRIEEGDFHGWKSRGVLGS